MSVENYVFVLFLVSFIIIIGSLIFLYMVHKTHDKK